MKQGLVRCWLTLDDSNAEISGNGIGICGYNGTDVLIMKNGSNLTMEDNGTAGIFLWGGKVKVEAGNTLTITGTGKDIKEITDSRMMAHWQYIITTIPIRQTLILKMVQR